MGGRYFATRFSQAHGDAVTGLHVVQRRRRVVSFMRLSGVFDVDPALLASTFVTLPSTRRLVMSDVPGSDWPTCSAVVRSASEPVHSPATKMAVAAGDPR